MGDAKFKQTTDSVKESESVSIKLTLDATPKSVCFSQLGMGMEVLLLSLETEIQQSGNSTLTS